jgi:DNA-binding transcriptional LysR family regulator
MSFTEAARHLHIAQPSVSHDIAELEKELGSKLFSRTKNGITLTPAGKVFLTEANKILNIALGARRKIEKMTMGESGELRFGFVAEQMIEPITPFLKDYYEKHPVIDMTFNSYTSIDVSRRLLSNELDLGFGRRESLMRHEDTDWMPLYTDPFYFAVPTGHWLAKNESIKFNQVANETILIMSRESNPGFYDLTQRLYMAHGVAPRLNTTSNDRISIMMMARIGMGIVLLTKLFFSAYNLHDLVLVRLDEDDAFHEVGVAWNKRAANPLVGPFLKDLAEYLKESPISI